MILRPRRGRRVFHHVSSRRRLQYRCNGTAAVPFFRPGQSDLESRRPGDLLSHSFWSPNLRRCVSSESYFRILFFFLNIFRCRSAIGAVVPPASSHRQIRSHTAACRPIRTTRWRSWSSNSPQTPGGTFSRPSRSSASPSCATSTSSR